MTTDSVPPREAPLPHGVRLHVRYDGGDMRCTLRGARCVGTWRGRTGLGWFEVTFDASSRTFDGTWGYDDDRANAAGFRGRRR